MGDILWLDTGNRGTGYANSVLLCDPEPDIILEFFDYFMHMSRPFTLLWIV